MYKWALCVAVVLCILRSSLATVPHIGPVSRQEGTLNFYEKCLAQCRKEFGQLKNNVVFPGVPKQEDIQAFKKKGSKDDGLDGSLRSFSLTLLPEESPAVEPSPPAVGIAGSGQNRNSRIKRKRFSKARRKNPVKRRRLRKRIREVCKGYCRPRVVTIGYYCYCTASICVPELGFKCLCYAHTCIKE